MRGLRFDECGETAQRQQRTAKPTNGFRLHTVSVKTRLLRTCAWWRRTAARWLPGVIPAKELFTVRVVDACTLGERHVRLPVLETAAGHGHFVAGIDRLLGPAPPLHTLGGAKFAAPFHHFAAIVDIQHEH